ncbi:hypothetical protein F4861DRAFT_549514, partial [Xylaria intraflava]
MLSALEAIAEQGKHPVATETQTLNKPSTFDGKDKSKFRSWWFKIREHVRAYPRKFETDAQKITWVGSLMDDLASDWHRQRLELIEKIRLDDNWESYTDALVHRFTDHNESYRNMEKMKALRYHQDICRYLDELQELNVSVQWSGISFRTHIGQVLPNKIQDLVWMKHDGLPESDQEYIEAIRKAGITYERMQKDPSFAAKEAANHKSLPARPATSSKPAASTQKPGYTPMRVWLSTSEALRDINQALINKRKAAKTRCWRCGRDNHLTLECRANRDLEGNTLPQAKVAATSNKRSREDDEEESDSSKRARIDAIE